MTDISKNAELQQPRITAVISRFIHKFILKIYDDDKLKHQSKCR